VIPTVWKAPAEIEAHTSTVTDAVALEEGGGAGGAPVGGGLRLARDALAAHLNPSIDLHRLFTRFKNARASPSGVPGLLCFVTRLSGRSPRRNDQQRFPMAEFRL